MSAEIKPASTPLRRVPYVACVADDHRASAYDADTREDAIGGAITEWCERVCGDFGPGEGPDQIAVAVYRDAGLCESVDADGECPCGEGDEHEDGRWVLHSWKGSEIVDIPMTYDAEGDPVELTDDELRAVRAGVPRG